MKQFASPIVIRSGKISTFKKTSLNTNKYDENWIQDICFRFPTLLPVEEIEPVFGGMIPVCRELATESGQIDLLFINETGFITIGECKLWRNPEARRKVIGQILDYAKDLSKWDYLMFEEACLKSYIGPQNSLYEIIQQYYPETEEATFVDNIQKNLRKGRFLLTIIGDGIRENMEEMIDYIQRNNHLSFTLALIEIPLFENAESNEIVITPRILAKTKEIERVVFKVLDDNLQYSKPEINDFTRAKSITEKIFFERLENNIGKANSIQTREFLGQLYNELKVVAKPGRGRKLSMNLKSADDSFNFGSIQEDGEVIFYAIVSKTTEKGARHAGIDYLKKLADITGASFDDNNNEWFWSVKRNGKYLNITDYLKHRDAWIRLISETLIKIKGSADNL